MAYPEPHYKGVERYLTLARVELDGGCVGGVSAFRSFRNRPWRRRLSFEHGYPPLLVGEDALDVLRLWKRMLSRIW